MSSTSVVPIFDPQGNVRQIPQEQADAALNAGGKRALKFQAPDGTQRWVPEDMAQQATAAGGKQLGAVAPQPQDQSTSFFSGVARGAKNLIHMPKAAYDAMTAPPANDDEKTMLATSGPVGLAFHRMVVEPSIREYQKGEQEHEKAEI